MANCFEPTMEELNLLADLDKLLDYVSVPRVALKKTKYDSFVQICAKANALPTHSIYARIDPVLRTYKGAAIVRIAPARRAYRLAGSEEMFS